MFRTLLLKELREWRRTSRLLIIALVLLVSGMISPLLAKYTPLLMRNLPGVPPELAGIIPEPTIVDSFAQYVKNISQFGLIVVIVLTMGVMAQEIERGTMAILLTKPVERSVVLLAKWAAGVLGILVGLVLASIGFTFYTLVLFGRFVLADFVVLNSLIAVFLIFYLTLALLASTLARTQAMAAAIAFGGLVLVMIIDALPGIGDYFPSQLLSWGSALFGGTPQTPWSTLISSIVMIAIFLAGAILRFQREEI
jgi:ABC-2 type transport system permease protein